MDEQEFNKLYDFNNFTRVTVANPTTSDYAFQITMQVGIDPGSGKLLIEARHYLVKAGGTEPFPGVVAKYYLDQMSKLLAQQEDKFKIFADFNTRKEYYDRLIVDVEDLIAQPMIELPSAQGGSKEAVTEPKEEAFAGLGQDKSRIGRPPKSQG